MKKLFTVIFAIITLASAFATTASAATIDPSKVTPELVREAKEILADGVISKEEMDWIKIYGLPDDILKIQEEINAADDKEQAELEDLTRNVTNANAEADTLGNILPFIQVGVIALPLVAAVAFGMFSSKKNNKKKSALEEADDKETDEAEEAEEVEEKPAKA